MNFKGITLAVLSFVLVAVSCSVENDTYMNDVNKEMASVTGDNVLLVAEVALDAIVTKGSTAEVAGSEDADAINNCIAFLLNAQNNVVGIVSTDQYTEGWTPKFMTKVQNGLHILAIANVDINKFSGCSSLNQIQNQVISNASSLPKQGEAAVEFGDFEGSTNTTSVPTFTLSESIVLKQIAAKVELAGFNYEYTGEDSEALEAPAVALQKVTLINAKNASYIFAEDNSSFETMTSESTTGATFSCFQNSDSDNKTALQLTMTIGAKTVVKSYTIKTPENGETLEVVKPGYIYRVTVKLSVNKISKEFDVDLQYEAVPFQAVTVNIPDFN